MRWDGLILRAGDGRELGRVVATKSGCWRGAVGPRESLYLSLGDAKDAVEKAVRR